MAQHRIRTHPLVLRRLEVARVVDVTPSMRRVTLVGPQLGAFTGNGHDLPAFVTASFDDHVKLVFAADGDLAAALPVQHARSIDWPPSEHRRGRDYTPRRFDADAGELDLDVVLHGGGPAVEWARTARPGDALHLAGPKSSLVLPDDLDWMLLAGDETALPAIGRFLDDRPLDIPVQVVVQIRHSDARQDLAVRDGDTLRWVVTPASSRLVDAVREVDWWPGRAYAWAAGESRSLLPLRRWLRHDRALPPSHTDVTGYWHAEAPGAAGAPGAAAALLDAEALLDPLPWLATRAAVGLGLLDALADAAVPLPDLAVRLRLDPGATGALVAYLAAVDVLRVDGAVALGPVGEDLLGDDHLRAELFGDGVAARTLDALLGLAPALRAGEPAWGRAAGHTLERDAEADPARYAELVADADAFAFVAGGVPDHPAWTGAARVTVTGPGALALLRAARDRGPLPDVVVVAPPGPLAVLADLGADLPVTFAAGPARRADVVVSTLELAHRTDAELVAHLAALAGHAERALLVDALRRTGPGGPAVAAEHALRTLAITGRGPRDAGDVARAAVAAGWRAIGTVPLGWDHEVVELRAGRPVHIR